MIQGSGEVMQGARETPLVVELAVHRAGRPVEVQRLRHPAHFVVGAAGALDREGFAAAVAEPALDRGCPLVGDQRVSGLPGGTLDPAQLDQPVRLPPGFRLHRRS